MNINTVISVVPVSVPVPVIVSWGPLIIENLVLSPRLSTAKLFSILPAQNFPFKELMGT
jgi:hypothetical protein